MIAEKTRQIPTVKPEQPKSQIIKEKGLFENILSFFRKK